VQGVRFRGRTCQRERGTASEDEERKELASELAKEGAKEGSEAYEESSECCQSITKTC